MFPNSTLHTANQWWVPTTAIPRTTLSESMRNLLPKSFDVKEKVMHGPVLKTYTLQPFSPLVGLTGPCYDENWRNISYCRWPACMYCLRFRTASTNLTYESAFSSILLPDLASFLHCSAPYAFPLIPPVTNTSIMRGSDTCNASCRIVNASLKLSKLWFSTQMFTTGRPDPSLTASPWLFRCTNAPKRYASRQLSCLSILLASSSRRSVALSRHLHSPFLTASETATPPSPCNTAAALPKLEETSWWLLWAKKSVKTEEYGCVRASAICSMSLWAQRAMSSAAWRLCLTSVLRPLSHFEDDSKKTSKVCRRPWVWQKLCIEFKLKSLWSTVTAAVSAMTNCNMVSHRHKQPILTPWSLAAPMPKWHSRWMIEKSC